MATSHRLTRPYVSDFECHFLDSIAMNELEMERKLEIEEALILAVSTLRRAATLPDLSKRRAVAMPDHMRGKDVRIGPKSGFQFTAQRAGPWCVPLHIMTDRKS
ncbi:hypothetical protein GQ53DRAFT_524485 [Thozetella sp. PMI_491]|nr:hypothetical protein GQ53DRAFT_524485 [Thozetella sp. PMI_491]